MTSRTTMFFFCTSAVTGALILGGALQGCGSSAGGGSGGNTGAGGSASQSGPTSNTSSAATGAGGALSAVPATIAQIVNPNDPNHVNNTDVKVTGVVATSIKFLVSKSSSSGACLWGVFLSSPGLTTTAPNTGILAVNNGTPASASGDGGKAYCPVFQANMPAGDLFPDDTAPGDVFDIVGHATSYVPSTCGAPDAAPPDNSNVAQYQIEKLTSVKRTSRGATLPTPAVLQSADVAKIAAGNDMAFLSQWGGVRVTVQNVQAELQSGMTFDSYGHMLMNDGLQVGDKLYYVGYLKGTDICYGPPGFPSTIPSFTSITGFVYLDYCTWGVSPADKCHDLVPPSDDCESQVDGGAEAGAAAVCQH